MSRISGINQRHETGKENDPMGENIQIIADLHKRAERKVTPQQRRIEAVSNFLGRPGYSFSSLIVVALWTVVNILLVKFGLLRFDAPPFVWLQGIVSLGALIQATVILITENRQDEVTERRRQLDLQVGLLLDQKISKLITMVHQSCVQSTRLSRTALIHRFRPLRKPLIHTNRWKRWISYSTKKKNRLFAQSIQALHRADHSCCRSSIFILLEHHEMPADKTDGRDDVIEVEDSYRSGIRKVFVKQEQCLQELALKGRYPQPAPRVYSRFAHAVGLFLRRLALLLARYFHLPR